MPLPVGLLEQFRPHADSFVETGTHRGDAIDKAIEAGYEEIFSVDIAPFCYGWASHRFRDVRTQVHLFCQDSRDFMRKMARDRKAPAVFWLDAHWCGGDGEMGGRDTEYEQPAPLLGELEQLAHARLRTHILLIDDVRMLGTDVFPAHDDVVGAIREVNSLYQIRYVDSPVAAGDIMVAEVP